jgi:murein DD-endopeptidase MepM/ murein hydrolase activator NlpD
MMRRLSVALVLALAVAVAVPAAADDPASELDRVRAEIAELNKQINTARTESRRVGEDLSAAEARLEVAQTDYLAARDKVDALLARIGEQEQRHSELVVELEALEGQIAETTARLHSTQEALELQAVALYMEATSATMGTLVFEFESVAQATIGIAYTDDVASETEDVFDTFAFLKEEESRQRDAAEVRRQESTELLAELDAERLVLEADAARLEELRVAAEAELAEVQRLLGSIRSQISAAEEHKDGLEADAARLQRELERLQSSSGEAPSILSYPVNGRVSSPFGYRVHPIFGTRRLHTGIDMSAPYGATISAAGTGTVILSGPYGGYGNAVVIDHGGGLATLYAHQSKIAVSVGQIVDRGQTIGYIGCTGYCTGPHLHFETRESGVPVDPMKYLG